jgi:uncharacterized protein (TIGR02145 family)
MKTTILIQVLLLCLFAASAQDVFRCGDDLKDSRDGTVYHTVLIGDQCWMKENMNIGTIVADFKQEDNGIPEKTCYENNPDNCLIYGGLYTWNEAMQWTDREGTQGICPEGWHVPSKTDWEQLSTFLGTDTAGQQMKVSGSHDPGWDGNNSSGFTALPAGGGYDNHYLRLGSWALFWSSTASDPLRAWFSQLDNFWYPEPPRYKNLYTGPYYLKTNGLSVRCLRDDK